jgi:hypothetical protein
MRAGMDNEILGNRILKMSWAVFDASSASHRLLTSDWPVEFSLGATPPVLSLPLSLTHLFVACDEVDPLNRFDTNIADPVVKLINAYVVSHARRYVFSTDEKQATFIRKRMSSLMVKPPFFPSFRKGLAVLLNSNQ